MFRAYIQRLSQSRFWISKWFVAAVILGVLAIAGIAMVLQQDIDFDTFLNYFALGLLIFVLITLFYGIIAIHDVPYEIAKHRNHPQQDAIHAAGWVSLFTLHAIWPFLWIWAMLYRPDRGWGFQQTTTGDKAVEPVPDRLEDLLRRVEALEARAKIAETGARSESTKPADTLKSVEPVAAAPKRGAR